jgi:hypothetical protein
MASSLGWHKLSGVVGLSRFSSVRCFIAEREREGGREGVFGYVFHTQIFAHEHSNSMLFSEQ